MGSGEGSANRKGSNGEVRSRQGVAGQGRYSDGHRPEFALDVTLKCQSSIAVWLKGFVAPCAPHPPALKLIATNTIRPGAPLASEASTYPGPDLSQVRTVTPTPDSGWSVPPSEAQPAQRFPARQALQHNLHVTRCLSMSVCCFVNTPDTLLRQAQTAI